MAWKWAVGQRGARGGSDARGNPRWKQGGGGVSPEWAH
jgi:hypothetical protein